MKKQILLSTLRLFVGLAGLVCLANLFYRLTHDYTARKEYVDLRVHAPETKSAVPSAAQALLAINPDYIGWITIDGTTVDYPIVRGRENEYYMAHTFTGQKNTAGAIFMDTGCEEGFDGPLVILYGHNRKDGSMFAPLARYLKTDFLTAHPIITIQTIAGERLTYRVTDARRGTINDPIFSQPTNAPPNADSLLVLSTCARGGNENERILVFAMSNDTLS
ncbi:MAG: class B sortase [Clostridiales bacterium]|nr:class B sortase [Clostridiales bacterium]